LSVTKKYTKQRPHKKYYLKKNNRRMVPGPKSKVFGSRVFKVMLNKEIYKNGVAEKLRRPRENFDFQRQHSKLKIFCSLFLLKCSKVNQLRM